MTSQHLFIQLGTTKLWDRSKVHTIDKFNAKSLKKCGSREEIWGMMDDEPMPHKDQEQINNYLAKIIQISGKYEGEYDLPSVKACYHKLLLGRKKG